MAPRPRRRSAPARRSGRASCSASPTWSSSTLPPRPCRRGTDARSRRRCRSPPPRCRCRRTPAPRPGRLRSAGRCPSAPVCGSGPRSRAAPSRPTPPARATPPGWPRSRSAAPSDSDGTPGADASPAWPAHARRCRRSPGDRRIEPAPTACSRSGGSRAARARRARAPRPRPARDRGSWSAPRACCRRAAPAALESAPALEPEARCRVTRSSSRRARRVGSARLPKTRVEPSTGTWSLIVRNDHANRKALKR